VHHLAYVLVTRKNNHMVGIWFPCDEIFYLFSHNFVALSLKNSILNKFCAMTHSRAAASLYMHKSSTLSEFHLFGASVEIVLKLDYPGLKKVKYIQILHLIGRLD